jgi:hypothetical protein
MALTVEQKLSFPTSYFLIRNVWLDRDIFYVLSPYRLRYLK